MSVRGIYFARLALVEAAAGRYLEASLYYQRAAKFAANVSNRRAWLAAANEQKEKSRAQKSNAAPGSDQQTTGA